VVQLVISVLYYGQQDFTLCCYESHLKGSEVLADMLFADVPRGDTLPLAVPDRDSENPFRQKDPLRVHAELRIMPSG
jgi:hypothetical protein